VLSIQDNSDSQYRSFKFRNNIPSLVVLAGAYWGHISSSSSYIPILEHHPRTISILSPSVWPFLSSCSLACRLHGASVLKIFVILCLNYSIAKICKGSKLGPVLIWIFNGAVLFANERNSGYRFGKFHPSLELLVRAWVSSWQYIWRAYCYRITWKASILDGTSVSILRCCDLCLSAWTITGHTITKDQTP
jgi:hypothetical protein